jgi:hypothetical protein
MKRNSQNANLQFHYEETYQGLPVQMKHGPLIVEYLALLYLTMQRALNEHTRTFAFRVDLRFPEKLDTAAFIASNIMMERFFASFKAKIRHIRATAKKKNRYAHDTTVRYVWAREIGHRARPHFHLVIFLNNDAFFSLGLFESKSVQRVWCLVTSCGSKLPSRSRGMSIGKLPKSPLSVLALLPLRVLPLSLATAAWLFVAKVKCQFGLQRALYNRLGKLLENAVLADQVFRLLVIGKQQVDQVRQYYFAFGHVFPYGRQCPA